MHYRIGYVLVIVCIFVNSKCNVQVGPDPWDYQIVADSKTNNDDIPPDLIPIPSRKSRPNNIGISDWFYKRLLAIVLKGGQIKENEDGSVDISIQMFYSEDQWNVLKGYIALETALSEDMFRRSLGLIEESIYKPTIIERISWAWHEYIQFYLVEYKTEITWTLSILAITVSTFWLWNHVSHRHIIIMLFVGLYIYEAFISYKEAEKQELEKFVTAMNSCKWFIWSSQCEVPHPDPLIFLKHLNPLKICIRMLSTIVTEPMLLISETMKVMIHGMTDGLWYPMDKIMYGILITMFNVLLIFFLIMIVFNFILNIPFNLNFLGILSVALKQRDRNFKDNNKSNESKSKTEDRISGETLTRILDVCSRALNTAQNTHQSINNPMLCNVTPGCSTTGSGLKRSSSTGRLQDLKCSDHTLMMLKDIPPKRINKKLHNGAGGDAK